MKRKIPESMFRLSYPKQITHILRSYLATLMEPFLQIRVGKFYGVVIFRCIGTGKINSSSNTGYLALSTL